MTQLCDSRDTSSASDMEEASKVPSLQRSGSISVSDDEGWPTCSSRSRCRRPKWTREEEMVLVEAHCTLGNAWVAIAECLPGRTPSEVKNIWHSTQRARKLQTRSVLRAYVSALKDRAEKPAARQQAMRAAQHFLSEGSGKVCSPAKRVSRRPAGQRQQQQQQQQHQQQQQQQQHQQLPQPRNTDTAASPPPSAAAGDALSEPEPVTAVGAHHHRAGAGREVLLVGDSAAAAAAPGATLAVTAVVVAAAAPGHRSTGHRSSLGSEWSCVSSSGALESWPPTTAGGGNFASAPTPPPVISFSPLVNTAAGGAATYAATYAAPPPPAAAARASAAVITSRFDSPTGPRPESRPFSNSPPLNNPPPPPPAATRSARCGSSDWRAAADTAQQTTTAVLAWQVPAATAGLTAAAAAAYIQPQQQQQREHSPEASWQCAGRGSDSSSAAHTAAAVWDPEQCAPEAPPARRGYVVSTGCNGHSGGGADSGSGLWAEGGRRVSAGLPAAGAVVAAEAPHFHLHSYTGQALSSKVFAPPLPAAAAAVRSAAAITAQLLGTVPCRPLPFSGIGFGSGDSSAGGGNVVTLGLYGIMDEELLACLRA